MTHLYLQSTGGDNSNSGATWALAKATLAGVDAIDAAGDQVNLSSAHAESTAGALTFSLAGTPASPTRLLSVSNAAEPPTTLAAGASITATGANSITINGSVYAHGITLVSGSGGATGALNFAQSASSSQVYKNCTLSLAATGTTQRIAIGTSANSAACAVEFDGCTFSTNNATQRLNISNADVLFRNCSFPALTNLLEITAAGRISKILFEACDLSSLNSSANLVNPTAPAIVTFRNCKTPSSFVLCSATPLPGGRISLYNSDSADTNYRSWVETYFGTIRSETTRVKTGGASDGTTPYSWKLTSTANANYPSGLLSTDELPAIWNATTGSSRTVTVDILHDSATNLTDAEIWLEVQYLGMSGFPISTIVSDAKTNVLATAADQTASSATWTTTGMANPNKQKLAVTFTPQEVGFFQARVMLAAASKTVYVDPAQQVT